MADKQTIETGRMAPAFTLSDGEGNRISLKDKRGSWVVLYFYPRDLTPGCTIEAHDFSKLLPDFSRQNAVVFGISPDSAESHCRFTDREQLTVTLLSDPDKKVMKKYGAWGIKNMYGKKTEGVIRSTVIIDPEGKIAHHWKKVKAAGHAEKVLHKLSGLIDTQ